MYNRILRTFYDAKRQALSERSHIRKMRLWSLVGSSSKPARKLKVFFPSVCKLYVRQGPMLSGSPVCFINMSPRYLWRNESNTSSLKHAFCSVVRIVKALWVRKRLDSSISSTLSFQEKLTSCSRKL